MARIRRLLDIVVTDGIGLDNGIPRLRALISTEEALVDPKRLEHLATLRDLICFRVTELEANGDARKFVEERYLDGHGALFPAVAAAWEEQIHSTQSIADMAVRMAELDGARATPTPDPETLSRRTTELVSDLVEPAKSEALDKLGEGRRALDIANAWVRAKLCPVPQPAPETPSP